VGGGESCRILKRGFELGGRSRISDVAGLMFPVDVSVRKR
jgi:hypothetical protein